MSAPVRRPPLTSVLQALRDSPIGIFAFRRDGAVHSLARSRHIPADDVDFRRGGPILGTPERVWRRAIEEVLEGSSLRTRLRVGEATAELHIDPWRDEHGDVIGGVGLTVDVTAHEVALRHRRSRERRLRRITDHLADVLAELDLEGRIRFVTPSVRALCLLEPEEAIGRSSADLIHPDDCARVTAVFREAVRARRAYSVEARVVRRDGEVRRAISRAEFVQTAEGEPRMLLFVRDVTELREERRRRERRTEIMQGVSELSRELLALPPEALGDGLEEALERTCRLTGVDACTLYAVDPHTFEQQRMGWSAPGRPVPPMPTRRDAIRMAWLGGELAAGRIVQAVTADDWPPEAEVERLRMEEDEVRSVLVVPVRSEAGLVGTLQLLGLYASRPVPKDEHAPLRILAEMLVGAYRRKLSLDAMERGRILEAEVARLSRRFIRSPGDGLDTVYGDAMALALRISRAQLAVLRPPHAGAGEAPRCLRAEEGGTVPEMPDLEACAWMAGELRAGRPVSFSDHHRLPPEAREELRRLRRGGTGSMLAVPLRSAEGAPGWLAVLAAERERVWSRGEKALLELVAELIVRVADREQVEQRLGEREAALRQSQKMDAVGRLAGGIAHEFNNLLMVIAGHTEALVDSVDEESDVAADLREIEAATERATALTRQLLTLSGPEAGRPHPVDVDAVVRGGERVWRRTLGEACGLVLQLEAQGAAVLGEPSDLEQILLNLLVNARDAMPEGGTVRVSTRRIPPEPGRDASAPGIVELTVQDEGEGIADEHIPEIFEPFFSTKGPGEGTGLGLSIVRHAAERLGARVRVDGRPGQGARFRVQIPETLERPAPVADRGAVAPSRGSGTILLAEDEDGVRRLMRRILQSAGYVVLEARDGAEALERMLAERDRIDAVVSDVVMPRVGGSGLLQALHERGIDIPVLLVSGYPQDVDGTPDGAAGRRLLYKPFTREALLQAVEELLRG